MCGIGGVLLASTTSRFSGYKLAYCSSAKRLQYIVAQWKDYLTSMQKVLGSFPTWVPFFGGGGGEEVVISRVCNVR